MIFRNYLSWFLLALLLPAMLIAAACGDDDDDDAGDVIDDAQQTVTGEDESPAQDDETVEPSPEEDQSPEGSPSPDEDEDVAGAVSLEIETTEDDPLAFSEDELSAPAGAEVTVHYLNDSNLPHNIHFFQGEDASAPSIAMTEIGTGPGDEQMVTFTAPEEPGTYFFHCDVHPVQMRGDFVVE